MHRRRALVALSVGALSLSASSLLAAWHAAPAAPLPTLRVIKSPTCGCCAKWVDYMKKEGFTVVVEHREEFTALKRANGVTAELQSCHTGLVGGYVVEGHVPADLVKKLLTEKPAGVKGLAVPGMPPSSPGMDAPVKEAYTVYSFDAGGHSKAYAQRK